LIVQGEPDREKTAYLGFDEINHDSSWLSREFFIEKEQKLRAEASLTGT
jgi:hypothetical protein